MSACLGDMSPDERSVGLAGATQGTVDAGERRAPQRLASRGDVVLTYSGREHPVIAEATLSFCSQATASWATVRLRLQRAAQAFHFGQEVVGQQVFDEGRAVGIGGAGPFRERLSCWYMPVRMPWSIGTKQI